MRDTCLESPRFSGVERWPAEFTVGTYETKRSRENNEEAIVVDGYGYYIQPLPWSRPRRIVPKAGSMGTLIGMDESWAAESVGTPGICQWFFAKNIWSSEIIKCIICDFAKTTLYGSYCTTKIPFFTLKHWRVLVVPACSQSIDQYNKTLTLCCS